ncbi:hypothetical protein [Scytonema sp. NUACC21]
MTANLQAGDRFIDAELPNHKNELVKLHLKSNKSAFPSKNG